MNKFIVIVLLILVGCVTYPNPDQKPNLPDVDERYSLPPKGWCDKGNCNRSWAYVTQLRRKQIYQEFEENGSFCDRVECKAYWDAENCKYVYRAVELNTTYDQKLNERYSNHSTSCIGDGMLEPIKREMQCSSYTYSGPHYATGPSPHSPFAHCDPVVSEAEKCYDDLVKSYSILLKDQTELIFGPTSIDCQNMAVEFVSDELTFKHYKRKGYDVGHTGPAYWSCYYIDNCQGEKCDELILGRLVRPPGASSSTLDIRCEGTKLVSYFQGKSTELNTNKTCEEFMMNCEKALV